MANNREYGGGVLHSNVVISLNANDAIEITDVGDFFAVHHLILGHGVLLTEAITFRAEDDGNSIVSEGVFENGQKLTFARSVKVLHITNKNSENLQFECSYGSGDVDYIGVEARLDPKDSKNLEDIEANTKKTSDHTEHQNINLSEIRGYTRATSLDTKHIAGRDNIIFNKTYGVDVNVVEAKTKQQQSVFFFELPEYVQGAYHITKIIVSYDFGSFLHGNSKLDYTCGINLPTAPIDYADSPSNGDHTELQEICARRALASKYTVEADLLKASVGMGFKRTRHVVDMTSFNDSTHNSETVLNVDKTFALPGAGESQPIISITTLVNKIDNYTATPHVDLIIRKNNLVAGDRTGLVETYWGNFFDINFTQCMENGRTSDAKKLQRYWVQLQVYGYYV